MASKKIGALWNRKSNNGVEYLSGVLDFLGEDIQIAVFFNDKKESGTKQPDYNIVRSGQQSDDDGQGGKRSFPGGNSEGGETSGPKEDEEIDIEDIPFN